MDSARLSTTNLSFLISLAERLRCPVGPPDYFGLPLYAHLQACTSDVARQRFDDLGAAPLTAWSRTPMYRWRDFERAFKVEE